uniref:Y-box factor n=2 Tax=Lygus hesperus TaxID=30085 RepID=A0A0K8TGK6_LYGHE
MVVVNIQAEGEKEPAAGSTPAEKQGEIKGTTNKQFLALKVTGTVKWFNVKSGYGFINRKDTGEDVFVHQSAIIKNNPKKAVRSVGDGETVEFDVVEGEKGNEAANVTGPAGEAVKGSPYAADKRRGFRQWFFRGGPRSRGTRKQGMEVSDGEEAAEEDDGNQNDKPRRYRNRRFVSGGTGFYPRRPSNRPDKNGEKDGGEGGDDGGEEDGRPTGEQRAERGAPRGRGGRGRRYPVYRGGRQGGPPKSRQQQGDGGDGGAKEGGGGEGVTAERGGRGGRGRGRPRYRRPQRSQSQADKAPKNSEGGQNSEGNNDAAPAPAPPKETTQAVQNTTDESAA